MKRIKVMLMSMLLLAVVGGALAFKAKFDKSFCTTTPAAGNTCPNLCLPTPLANTTTTIVGGVALCTTLVPGGGDCARVACPNWNRLKGD